MLSLERLFVDILLFLSLFLQFSSQDHFADGDTKKETIYDVFRSKRESIRNYTHLYKELYSSAALEQGPMDPLYDTKTLISNGTCRAITFQDLLAGANDIPAHLQLSLIPGTDNLTAVNLSSNLTAERRKISCHGRNLSDDNTTESVVQLVNSTELLYRLSITNDSYANCVIVLFYAPWCPFCAEVAPHFNALPRVFSKIDFMAIDAINFNNLNARFGTIAVPNILFFHNSKAVARFNSTIRTLTQMSTFIQNITGLKTNTSTNITEEDYIGPLSNEPTNDTDYLLWLSWVFIIAFSSVMFSRSHTGISLWNYVNSLGAAHEHHHID